MPWVYQQSTGELSYGGVIVGRGYSGHDECKNDPTKQDVPMHGPIPRGIYTIGDPYNTETHGPVVMRLTPDPANEMFGRAGFLIHGDSVAAPGAASEGCIIMSRPVRLAVAASPERALQVIA